MQWKERTQLTGVTVLHFTAGSVWNIPKRTVHAAHPGGRTERLEGLPADRRIRGRAPPKMHGRTEARWLFFPDFLSTSIVDGEAI